MADRKASLQRTLLAMEIKVAGDPHMWEGRVMNIEKLISNKDIVAVAVLKEDADGPADVHSAGATNGRLPKVGPLMAAAVNFIKLDKDVPYCRLVIGGMATTGPSCANNGRASARASAPLISERPIVKRLRRN